MQAPQFWNSPNFLSTLLVPASWIYDAVRRLRISFITPVTLPVPVICVGNLIVGGAGKTPIAMYLGKQFKDKNIPAFFLSRGYGGSLKGPVLVDSSVHNAGEVGDEPLLLARILPTVVARDRLAGAQFSIAQGAKVIVMDDGFQNPAINKTLSLAVVDGTVGFGNEYLLPAGPLREPLEEGIARADMVIVMNGSDEFTVEGAKQMLYASTQPIHAEFVKDKRWLAFCGIAYPDKFFATLHNLGGNVIIGRRFADHHPYMPHEIEALRREAAEIGAELITTAKDMVRIPTNMQHGISVLNIAVSFNDEATLLGRVFDTVACA